MGSQTQTRSQNVSCSFLQVVIIWLHAYFVWYVAFSTTLLSCPTDNPQTPLCTGVMITSYHRNVFCLSCLFRGIHLSLIVSPIKGQAMQTFDVLFCVSLQTSLNTRTSDWWFETPRGSCHTTVIGLLLGECGQTWHWSRMALSNNILLFYWNGMPPCWPLLELLNFCAIT